MGSRARRLVHCTLPPRLVDEPVLHDLVRATTAVVNVRRANVDVEAEVAWYLLELKGTPAELDGVEDWLRARGVHVEVIHPS